jgi:hypothetical protein
MSKRNQYAPEFMAKVALKALKRDETGSQGRAGAKNGWSSTITAARTKPLAANHHR